MNNYDLVIIGGGPGGYEAALEAARCGMKTALIERENIGGTCLNRGCIPTKILLHSADLYREMQGCERFGLRAENVTFDLDRVQARKTEVVAQLRGGIAGLLKKSGVDVYQGTGSIRDAGTVFVRPDEQTAGTAAAPQELHTKYILIATGSRPAIPPIPGADLPGVMTSDDLLELGGKPLKRLLIIGGGVIGMEFASIFSAFGSAVTVIEALPRILPNMDKEISQSLKMLLKKRGVELHTGARIEAIRRADDSSLPQGATDSLQTRSIADDSSLPQGAADTPLTVVYTEKDARGASGEDVRKDISADGVLICTGRRPLTDGLFEEDFSLEMERGRIVTDEFGRTSVPGVYAIGDVTGGVMLAHAATAQGRNAVAHMSGRGPSIRADVIPACIYTDPEIASVGLTLDEAKSRGFDADSVKYVMTANGRTVLTGQERGYIRIVYENGSGRLLGAQMMSARATDMIAEFTQAIVNGHTLEELRQAVYPHPTFSEAIGEVLRQL